MNHQTINSVDLMARMRVNESNNYIDIRCNPDLPCYILTTSPTPMVRESLLYVQGLGEYYCYAGSFTRRANMPSYLIMLALSGNEVLEYQGARYDMEPGTFYWIDCVNPHYFYTMKKDQPRHAMWVHFYGPGSEFYYRQFLRNTNNSAVCKLPEEDEISGCIKELIRLYNNSSESLEIDIAASAIITRIAVACIQAATGRNVQTPIPRVVLSVKSYIGMNYNEPITLSTLSDRFSINKYHLQKLFKRYIGLSPNDYLIHTRITRAKELLRSTDNSVSSISREIGIDDASNFTRLFKKYENTTPNNYRRNWIDPRINIVNDINSNARGAEDNK